MIALGLIGRIVAIGALAQACAWHARLEALAVVLLALGAAAVTPLEVVLDLDALRRFARKLLHPKLVPACIAMATNRAGARTTDRLSIDDLAVAEGVRVAHQDLLLSLQADGVVRLRVVAVAAGALGPAEPVVGEALAVELEAARLAAVARLVGLLHLALGGLRLSLEGQLGGLGLRGVEEPGSVGKGVFIAGARLLLHGHVAVVHLQSLGKGVVDRRHRGRLKALLLIEGHALHVAIGAHPLARLGRLRMAAAAALALELLEALLGDHGLVEGRGVGASVEADLVSLTLP